VQQFLEITGQCRKFVHHYAEKALPLLKLLKGALFGWGPEQQTAFELLQLSIIDQPVLMLPAANEPYETQTDASDFAIGAVLYQNLAATG
jgi:hypothetical protein